MGLPCALRISRSGLRRPYSSAARFRPAAEYALKDLGTTAPHVPVILRNHFQALPVLGKWFQPSAAGDGISTLNADYMLSHGDPIVPLELTRSTPGSEKTFELFEAPMSLLLSHIMSDTDPSMRLYLAQCPLEDLPAALRDDLGTPELLSCIGKGDLYGSSLWMGRPPTRTPLHRDPNPNLFVQLAGRKIVRFMEPDDGKDLYMQVRAGAGHANMRGVEMMVGEENKRLEDAVWAAGSKFAGAAEGLEAVLESGDGLYVPLGWWHSVRGVGDGVNASANWWFR